MTNPRRCPASPLDTDWPTSLLSSRGKLLYSRLFGPSIRILAALALTLAMGWAGVRSIQAGEPPADLAGQILAELNRVRTKPGVYADFLATRRPAYREDKRLALPGQPILRTQEGVAALDEAIATLRSLPGPLPALTADDRLTRVARALADDQSRSGATGHTSADGATLTVRLGRQGEVDGTAGENAAYGAKTAEDIVFSLVVDDGVAGRGHRQNILNPEYRLVGIAHATHPKWGQVCIMDFAHGWR